MLKENNVHAALRLALMTTIASQPIDDDNNDLAPAKIEALLERIRVACNIDDTAQGQRVKR